MPASTVFILDQRLPCVVIFMVQAGWFRLPLRSLLDFD
jgi:hypothetical protein